MRVAPRPARARDARRPRSSRARSGRPRRDDRRAAVTSASFVLEHVPDLVRYGSKPSREPQQLEALTAGAPSVRRGGGLPAEPGVHRQPRSRRPVGRDLATGGATRSRARRPAARHGDVMDQHAFYELLAEVDQFELMRLGAEPEPGELALHRGRRGRRRVRGRPRGGRVAHAARVAREPVGQGQRGARAATTCSHDHRRRPCLDHPRDRLRRGGRRRPVPARRRQRREGDRRALRARRARAAST